MRTDPMGTDPMGTDPMRTDPMRTDSMSADPSSAEPVHASGARADSDRGDAAAAGEPHDLEFLCPLAHGFHARPASLLSELAARFAADIQLVNARSGMAANAKSVLDIVANDVQLGDACRIRTRGRDAQRAHAALREFVRGVLPGCDETLPPVRTAGQRALPRALIESGAVLHAGTVVCPGIGRGVVVCTGGLALPDELLDAPALSRAEEEDRVQRALLAVQHGLEAEIARRPRSQVELGILRAHLSIAGDVGLHAKIRERLAAGDSAARAVVHAAEFFSDRLRGSGSAYVRERVVDVQDVGVQMLAAIYGDEALLRAQAIRLSEPSVVAAENLSPRQLLALDRALLRGLVLEHAGATSHAVILARSFDIPTLTGVENVRGLLEPGAEIVVDANHGVVVPVLSPALRRFYEREERALRRRRDRLAQRAHAAASTRDGQALEVGANVATAEEIAGALASGADGIGLFRTEMLFLGRESAPSEEEQLAIYAQAARAAAGKPVLVRTLDVGGDKPVPYFGLAHEENPALGVRGVRVYPRQLATFRSQLRAIVRASAFGNVWIMVPMISSADEVRWVKQRVAEVRAELAAQGVAHDPAQRVGVMLEVPATAFLLDQLSAEADFFSIGTNDMAQYFFAADRDNREVAALSSARNPAFLRFLAGIVRDARAHGRWVGMCGEMARSPRNLPLLLGLGLDEISTAAPEIPAVKAAIAALSAADCRELLARALDCRSAAEVEVAVAKFRARAAGRSLIEPGLVEADSDSATKAEAIREIVNAFYVTGRTDDPLAIEDAVWAREAAYSTGLGHGFAIPHCKSDAIAASSIALVRLREPVEWGSLDGEPVRCVILLAVRASDEEGTHMRVFSKLARRLMHADFRARMLAARDGATLQACLADELGLDAG